MHGDLQQQPGYVLHGFGLPSNFRRQHPALLCVHGRSIVQALALGADAVCVGRPVLHGLALDGEQGVKDVIDLLRNDLELAMRLSGCPDLKSITRDMVLTPAEYQSRL